MACGGACVDTTISTVHCGKCDHACGAGACTASTCQPFPVAPGFTDVRSIASSPSGLVIAHGSDLKLCGNPDGCTQQNLATIRAGLSQLNDVTVAGTDVFFDANQGDFEIVYRCPVAGCPGTGPIEVENVVNDSIGRVVAGPSTVAWTRYQSFYGPYSRRCDSLPGCGTVAEVLKKPTTSPTNGYYNDPARELTVPSKVISVGQTTLLWATGGVYNSNAKQLRACPLAAGCTAGTDIDTSFGSVTALNFFNGKHYGAMFAQSGGQVVFSVNDVNPGAPTVLVADASGITDVAVDASGIYWINATTGKILRCANLAGCPGSGETLASFTPVAINPNDPRPRIALDAKFVYWSTKTTVMKVAK